MPLITPIPVLWAKKCLVRRCMHPHGYITVPCTEYRLADLLIIIMPSKVVRVSMVVWGRGTLD